VTAIDAAVPADRIVQADGRTKAYRPMVEGERDAAFRAGLEAYARGDFFLAHELLEPAWLGTPDLAERALLQGLIKLAAADVHRVRGNQAGVVKNLEGSLRRLESAITDPPRTTSDLDLGRLIGLIRSRLDRARRGESTAPIILPRGGR
jgi:predicted metal-dependent hydrolase